MRCCTQDNVEVGCELSCLRSLERSKFDHHRFQSLGVLERPVWVEDAIRESVSVTETEAPVTECVAVRGMTVDAVVLSLLRNQAQFGGVRGPIRVRTA